MGKQERVEGQQSVPEAERAQSAKLRRGHENSIRIRKKNSQCGPLIARETLSISAARGWASVGVSSHKIAAGRTEIRQAHVLPKAPVRSARELLLPAVFCAPQGQ